MARNKKNLDCAWVKTHQSVVGKDMQIYANNKGALRWEWCGKKPDPCASVGDEIGRLNPPREKGRLFKKVVEEKNTAVLSKCCGRQKTGAEKKKRSRWRPLRMGRQSVQTGNLDATRRKKKSGSNGG